ncbi:hypothetical protein RND81_13G106500 [Saponaria officinalis]|uniref:Uncharacterized protein n=1 Tax=Saponaria officinalis TaxID=3572 RepID=A0AAW1GZ37_SAPOF
MVLVFIYLDRCVFKVRTVSRQFPTLSTWSKEAISIRIKDELQSKKTFVMGSIEAPILINKVPHMEPKIELVPSAKSTIQHERQSEPEVEQVEKKDVVGTSNHNKMFADKLVYTAENLAQAFVEYKSIATEAIHKLPCSAVVSKMAAAVDGMADGFNLSQQSKSEGNVEANVKDNNGGNIEQNVQQNDDNVDENVANVEHGDGLSNFEKMWSYDAEILEALALMEEAFQPMAPQISRIPEKTICKQKNSVHLRSRSS